MKSIHMISMVASLVLASCGGGSSSSSAEFPSSTPMPTPTTVPTPTATPTGDPTTLPTPTNSPTPTPVVTTAPTETPTQTPTTTPTQVPTITYPVVDTNQLNCYSSSGSSVSCSSSGQDGAYSANQPSYTNNGDGTVTDNVTSLVWQQSPDTTGDGVIDASDKLTQSAAVSYCANLTLGGQSDWRLPDIKTLYSLMDFSGEDPSGYSGTDTSTLEPFIDDATFFFGYGDTDAGERVIDAQWATMSIYVYTVMNGSEAMFGLNLADGRIKGYPTSNKNYYVQCVRGNESYAQNSLVDNGNETISDSATGLMWQKSDNGNSVDWDSAISYCENLSLANHSDWRLPNAKELHSIVDYTRSPDTTASAALSSLFSVTAITNEEGVRDYGFYWSSTTHKNMQNGANGVYVSFGRALGYMNNTWMDVHGAGAQRSDPKDVDSLNTNQGGYTIVDGAITHGPQGDVVRGKNLVRCVRD
ncbi:MAG: DUF1566 domain-containing protein [Campylobacterota bacterium]|nr:DUF1566 domain-containing protein [Campylobacterota bacterium]